MSDLIIYHINNKDNKYKIVDNPLIKVTDTICIKDASEEALLFIIDYINYNKCNNELQAPECPLEEIDLPSIFECERQIFGDILNIECPAYDLRKKLLFIKDVLHISAILDIPILQKKINAILAYYMIHITPDVFEEISKK